MDSARGLLGLAAMVGFSFALSGDRRAINWRLVLSALGLQLALAGLFLKVPGADLPIRWMAGFFVTILGFSDAGAQFVFGFLASDPGFWSQVNASIQAAESGFVGFGLIFAFKVLPTVIFFSALTSILYYLGILQIFVKGFAWLLQKTMGLSGAESLSAAANVFVGQTEAPLVVKPYIESMTRSELLSLMTGGMATIAGSVFGAYVWILGGDDPVRQAEVGGHLLTASILSAPAAIMAAKMLLPQEGPVSPDLQVNRERLGENAFDAISLGTSQGLQLALNIAAMLITFLAFIAMINFGLGWLGGWSGVNSWISTSTGGTYESFGLEFLFGILFAPVAWLIGAGGGDLLQVGQLLGIKLVANEFVAYEQLGQMLREGQLGERSVILATYALCGFANFSSMGIQIGGISVLAPGKRVQLSQLALRSVIAGTIACLCTASVAGIFI